MKTAAANHPRSRSSRQKKGRLSLAEIQGYFAPIEHQRSWRVRLGVGSFLTFEFGSKTRDNGHEHGSWHLWIYMSNWTLMHHGRAIVNSDSDRRPISAAVRRLEGVSFTDIEFDPRTSATTFVFEDFRLAVTPADYLDSPDEQDHYWLFFMPDHVVLAAGPGGIDVRSSNK
jgi:hypothetical protein